MYKKKGIPCIWYKYNTDITWNNFHFKISVDGIPTLDWTLPNFVANDVKDFTVTSPQGAIYLGYPSNAPDVIWTKQRSDVKTPGMGNNWLVVNL